MKEAMVKKSGDMTFWPVTVRPPDQLRSRSSEKKPYPMLQRAAHREVRRENPDLP